MSGGTQPYLYKQLDSAIWIEDTKVYQMPEGLYTFEFTDNHNCPGNDTLLVYMDAPDSLKFDTLIVNHTTCATDNGSIYFTMKGGTPPYDYLWTNIYHEFLSDDNFMDCLKQEAQYLLTVTDKNNCRFNFDQQIYRSTVPTIEGIRTTDVPCYNDSTGKGEIDSVIPGVPYSPYEIYWSNGDTGWGSDRFFAGNHFATVLDSNGCSSVRYFEIKQPEKLEFSLADSANAICYHAYNGFLNIVPKGGVGGYKAYWSNGDTTFYVSDLPQGIYDVVVTDSNDCIAVGSYEITQPDTILISLGVDQEICPGTEYTLDGFAYDNHEWSLNNEFFSDERFVHLSQEGTYSLIVTNKKGCQGSADFVLTIGNSALKADFLMTSQANLGDTLHIVELSNLPLDSLQWDYDEENFLDFTAWDDPFYILKLKSYQTGVYNIGLTAYAGGCMATQTKQVEILEMDDSTNTFNYVGYNPLIKEMSVGPNPTDGEFLAKITLREIANIQLTVYSVDYGQVVDTRSVSGFDYYEIPYNLSGRQSGMYIIMVTASNERKQTKLILRSGI